MNSSLRLTYRKKLKNHLIALFEREGKECFSFTGVFCSDKYLLSINKEFLGHNDYTDIITFSLADSADPIVGELYISADRVRENARQLGVSINEEVCRVIFHGALHLCGYEDKTSEDKASMTLAEEKYLAMYFA
ncbi:MAG: rRNA maturation RNase YbeY [Ferruginibacter sp.]